MKLTDITPTPLPSPVPQSFTEAEKKEVAARTLTRCYHCQSMNIRVVQIVLFIGMSIAPFRCLDCKSTFTSCVKLL